MLHNARYYSVSARAYNIQLVRKRGVQSAENNPDGLEEVTGGFDDGRSPMNQFGVSGPLGELNPQTIA